MKHLAAVLSFFLAAPALAHPGHGRPGWVHFHEFSDGIVIALGLIAAGLLLWAWKK